MLTWMTPVPDIAAKAKCVGWAHKSVHAAGLVSAAQNSIGCMLTAAFHSGGR